MPNRQVTQQMITDALANVGALPVGNVFYVDSGATYASDSATGAADTAAGKSPDDPFATLDFAIGQCTASNGDIIVVMPGHAETVSAAGGLDIDVAGITIVGVGNGSNKPTVTLGTATTADVDIDAANILIKNIRFVGAIDDLAVMIDANADDLTLEDCEFLTTATAECLNFINFATTKDNLTVRRCRFLQPADPTGTDGAAATGAIYVVDSENILVEDCTFDGFFETACLHNKTTALKYLTWRRNNVNQQLTITGRRLLLVAGVVGCDIGVDTDFVPGLGYKVIKVEDCATATADNLFTVAGKVLIGLWTGEVTTVLTGAGHTDYVLGIASGAVAVATSSMTTAAAGFMFQVTGDPADTVLTSGTNGGVAVVKASDCDASGLSNRVTGLAGLATLTLAATRTASTTGAIQHELWYMPLEPGAHVVAAA
jgi:hypothetical protein